jgi:ABC-type nitrate/sulfonate/bicarbonate transport system substrate-binding protein
MKPKQAIGTMLAVLILAALSYYYYKPSQKIRIVDCLNAANIHVLVADKMGFFDDEGLDVQVSYVSLGKLAMDALVSGSVDYAGVVEMNVAHYLYNDDDVVILSEMGQPTNGIKLLGRSDKGVKRIEDLKGKKIAVFFGVNIHVFATEVIRQHSIEDVELVSLAPPEAASAFINGDVDAIITWQPIVDRILEALGENVAILTDESENYWTYKMILVTSRTHFEKNEEEASRIIRALKKADDFIIASPDKVYDLVATHLGMPREKVPGYLSEIHHGIELTSELRRMIEFEIEWLPEHLAKFYKDKEPKMLNLNQLFLPSSGVLPGSNLPQPQPAPAP